MFATAVPHSLDPHIPHAPIEWGFVIAAFILVFIFLWNADT